MPLNEDKKRLEELRITLDRLASGRPMVAHAPAANSLFGNVLAGARAEYEQVKARIAVEEKRAATAASLRTAVTPTPPAPAPAPPSEVSVILNGQSYSLSTWHNAARIREERDTALRQVSDLKALLTAQEAQGKAAFERNMELSRKVDSANALNVSLNKQIEALQKLASGVDNVGWTFRSREATDSAFSIVNYLALWGPYVGNPASARPQCLFCSMAQSDAFFSNSERHEERCLWRKAKKLKDGTR